MNLPAKQKALLYIVAAFLYIILPVDLAPDYFPIVGWLDDIFVAMIALHYAIEALKGKVARGPGRRDPRRGPQNAKPAEPAPLDDEDPLTVLGLEPGASGDEIKSAYRKAMAEYHPDKVEHLGPELRALADKKAKAIQKAFAALTGRD